MLPAQNSMIAIVKCCTTDPKLMSSYVTAHIKSKSFYDGISVSNFEVNINFVVFSRFPFEC